MINAGDSKKIADQVSAAKKVVADQQMIESLEVSIKKSAETGQYSLWTAPVLNKEVTAVLKLAGYKVVSDSLSQYPDDEQGTTIWWN
jgi:hypothetical protein